jgi:phage FluMu protein Com
MNRWMDSDLQRSVQRMVQQHCANCHSGDRCFYAPLGQSKCFYFRELDKGEQVQRCRYFEEAVLGNNAALEAEYSRKLSLYLGAEPHQKNQRRCAKCGKLFEKTSNRNIYCPTCKSVAARESATRRKRIYRQRQRANSQ